MTNFRAFEVAGVLLAGSPPITDAERKLVALCFGDQIRQILSEKV